MTEHTPGPWATTLKWPTARQAKAVIHRKGHALATGILAGSCGDLAVAFACGETEEQADANAKRIVACVNACEGKNPEAFDELLAACKAAVTMFSSSFDPNSTLPDDIKATWTEVFRRDPVCQQLVAAVKKAEAELKKPDRESDLQPKG